MVYWCVTAPNYPPPPTQITEAIDRQEQNDYLYGVPVCVKNDRLKLRGANDANNMDRVRHLLSRPQDNPELAGFRDKVDLHSDPSFSLNRNNVHVNPV